ncbi:ABC transporter substrate-binding protein [Haloprofundus salinisoli]|uniref:ABC transporter substrate-binding protein n=1 Tax=Haloprofundus salinisoli TaxID=2876193 RepID=UPI001CCB7AE6|nr:ABC transporter substrate-binding protein [Haloprofundus salinisoli]
MSDKSLDQGRRSYVSRRKMLALSTGLAAGLAGCGGQNDQAADPDGNSTDTNGTGGSSTDNGETNQTIELAESTLKSSTEELLEDINWNRYSRNIAFSRWFFAYLQSNYITGDTYNWLLEDLSYDKEALEMTYKFKEDFYWHDGTPVTAEDYYNQQEIDRLMDPEGSDIESHELVDDYTMVAKRKKELNPILIGVEENRLWTRRDKNREWLEKFQDVSSQAGRDEVIAELTDHKVSTQEFRDEGLANSTFKLKEWSETEVVLEKFDQHPFADDVNFDTLTFKVCRGGSCDQLVINDQVDFDGGKFDSNLQGASPDNLQTLSNVRGINGRSLVFNYGDNEHLARRGVRRAFTALLDFDKMADIFDRKFVAKNQTGLPGHLEAQYLGNDFIDNLIQYDMGSNEEQATQFLEMEGYSKEGSKWVDEDGKAIDFHISTDSTETMAAYGKSMQEQLNGFGFDVEFTTKESGTWYQDFLAAENGDVFPFVHGWASNEPLNFYDYSNHYKMRLGTGGEVEQWLADGETHSQVNGRPLTPTVPEEVGALEVEGSGRELNLYQLVEDLKTAQTMDETKSVVRDLAWYFNYDLPLIDTFGAESAMWGDTQNWEWPSRDHNAWYQAYGGYWEHVRRGLVKAKEV